MSPLHVRLPGQPSVTSFSYPASLLVTNSLIFVYLKMSILAAFSKDIFSGRRLPGGLCVRVSVCSILNACPRRGVLPILVPLQVSVTWLWLLSAFKFACQQFDYDVSRI